MSCAIVWFRRDLRLADNPAFAAAVASGLPLLCLYVHAPEEESPWAPGAASRAWLHRSLQALDRSLRQRGARLVLRCGASAEVLQALVRETGATHVFWNRLYEPAVIARDSAVKQGLRAQGIEAHSHNAALLFEPWQLATGNGAPYKVFTPFWRNARARLQPAAPPPVPSRVEARARVRSDTLASLSLQARPRWDRDFWKVWTPGEAGAQAQLRHFIEDALREYASDRDRPDRAGTSRLSPHLHFGEIGPRQLVWALARRELLARAEKFLGEIGWREFSHHLLYHFPQIAQQPLNPQFAHFPWGRRDEGLLQAWRQGRTGIPIVDAGMRELWHSGWMHNRVRMIVASLLTKNLRMHWLEGAHWFWDTLVDADLANNSQGWQWTAGSGADAAPYFRIFNPVLQGERFDPDGAYVRQWVPELRALPAKFLHQPWTAGTAQLAAAGLAGSVYEAPLVDLKRTRDDALAAYQRMRAA